MYPEEMKKTVVKRCDRRAAFDVSSQSGVSLLIIVISILVMAVLAAAMYAITSTSYFNQASAQDAMKAQYMMESGERIVASEYLHAANNNTKLADLNERNFSAGGSSGFTLNIYPYWLYAAADQAVSTSITLNLPGALPRLDDGATAITFPTKGILRDKVTFEVESFTGAHNNATTSAGTPIDFTLSAAFSSTIPSNRELFVGFVQNEALNASIFAPASQTVVPNGATGNRNLILNTISNIATFFPPEDGNFSLIFGVGALDIIDYHYDKRQINTITGVTTLTNIQRACLPSTVCPPYPTMTAFTTRYPATPTAVNLLNPAETTQIYVGKSLGIRSTGSSGN